MPRKVETADVCGALLTWGTDNVDAMDILSGGTTRIMYKQFRDAMMAADLLVSEPSIRSKWVQLTAKGAITSSRDRGYIHWDLIKIGSRLELCTHIEVELEQKIKKQKNKKTDTEGAVA